MKLATFFISRTELIFVKTLIAPESTFKIKSIIRCLLSEILLKSAVIWVAQVLGEFCASIDKVFFFLGGGGLLGTGRWDKIL